MIDKNTIDRIYEAADIVDVVQDYITLKKRGVNYTACCPFHDEKTPSFSVSPSKNIFKCFGCGKAGNAITFVMEHEHLTYIEALKLVAAKYGIEIAEKELTPEETQQNNDRESMMALTAFAQQYFAETMRSHHEGKNVALPYFAERGMPMHVINLFQVGYCTEQYNGFAQEALKKGYKKDFLLRTGLCYERSNGELADRFAGRVIFPIHSVSGRVIGFGGRTLKQDKNIAKYVNSPESEIYHKSDTLYGIFFAKKSIVQQNKCYLVEGYMDVQAMFRAGIENTVASSGTSLTAEQVKLMQRFTQNVTVLYDGDSAGIKAAMRAIDMLLEAGMQVRALLLPDGEDPDSFSKSRSSTEMMEYIAQHEKDIVRFKSGILLGDAENDPLRRASAVQEIMQSISLVPNAIARTMYINECSRLMNVSEETLTQEVASIRRKRHFGKEEIKDAEPTIKRQNELQTPALPDFTDNIVCREQERELVYYLLKFGQMAIDGQRVSDYIIDSIVYDDMRLRNLEYRQIFEEYQKLKQTQSDVRAEDFLHHPDQKICKLAADLLSSKYTPSRIWETRNAAPSSEEDGLNIAVPKAVTVYKAKVVELAIREKALQLEENDSEENTELIEQIAQLDGVRNQIAHLLQRVIP